MSDSDVWNLKNLDGPPMVTFDYSLSEYESLFSNTEFHSMFEYHLNKLIDLIETKQNFFKNEKLLLEKLIYKNWNPLRKEKYMQQLRQLKKMLSNYEELKLAELSKSIKHMITSRQPTLKTLPSREVNEYLLVRLCTAFKLLEFTMRLIRDKLYVELMRSIQNAVYLANNYLFLSAVSRIYFVLKKYKQNVMFVYNSLREHIGLFKSTSNDWSPAKIDNLALKLSTQSIKKEKKNLDETELNLAKFERLNLEEDLGVTIERNTLDLNCDLEKKKFLIKNIQKIFKTSQSVKKFEQKFKKFLKTKSIELNFDYLFLKEVLEKKLISKKDFTVKKLKKKLILKTIYKSISKYFK